ncbi:hypothetical protein [Paenibacillus sp. ALJ109b]|uniref:hypothetical protein n=1 Tax=Paenibacillus sp. ALJ109b TaxID=2709068 RepID=UPI0013D8B7C0|nr:hypothetical protein [Paenibacillus sp. ALJ109b]NEU60358.1 hypothetical protein [Paenibacillus sp. ALJ109b]
MALHYIAVNKSGVAVPVYTDQNNKGSRVGTIYNREVYCVTGYTEGGDTPIMFRNSSGNIVYGIFNLGLLGISESAESPIDEYAYHNNASLYIPGQGNFAAVEYKTRRSLRALNQSGSFWTNIPSGSSIFAKKSYGAQNGEINEQYLQFNAYRDPNGNLIYAPSNIGFIDIGISGGSTPTSIGLYGTW